MQIRFFHFTHFKHYFSANIFLRILQILQNITYFLRFQKLVCASLLFISCVFFLQGCKDNTIIMATAGDFRPFEFVEGGEIRGIDIDIAKEIAKRLNKKLEIKNMKFDSVMSALNSGTADFAISAISINSTREKIVDFTTPYYDASQMVITQKDDYRFINISSKEELISRIKSIEGIKIAVSVGTTGYFYVIGDKDWGFSGFPNAVPKVFSNNSIAIRALQNHQADIMIIDEMVASSLSQGIGNSNTNLLPFKLTNERYGIAISKSKPQLKESIQEALTSLQNDGTLEKIIAQYYF